MNFKFEHFNVTNWEFILLKIRTVAGLKSFRNIVKKSPFKGDFLTIERMYYFSLSAS